MGELGRTSAGEGEKRDWDEGRKSDHSAAIIYLRAALGATVQRPPEAMGLDNPQKQQLPMEQCVVKGWRKKGKNLVATKKTRLLCNERWAKDGGWEGVCTWREINYINSTILFILDVLNFLSSHFWISKSSIPKVKSSIFFYFKSKVGFLFFIKLQTNLQKQSSLAAENDFQGLRASGISNASHLWHQL
jgi:hypothetical protein